MSQPIPGRDGVCHWFVFHNYDLLGSVRLGMAFDWMKTDKCSAQLVCSVIAADDTEAFMHWNWDDGAMVYLDGKLIADQRNYPENGHGLVYRDRFDFEEVLPVLFEEGESTLAITSINSHGVWGVNVRFTDKDGWPIEKTQLLPAETLILDTREEINPPLPFGLRRVCWRWADGYSSVRRAHAVHQVHRAVSIPLSLRYRR